MYDSRSGLPRGEVTLYITLKAVAADTFLHQCTNISSSQITAECFSTFSCIKDASFCCYQSCHRARERENIFGICPTFETFGFVFSLQTWCTNVAFCGNTPLPCTHLRPVVSKPCVERVCVRSIWVHSLPWNCPQFFINKLSKHKVIMMLENKLPTRSCCDWG